MRTTLIYCENVCLCVCNFFFLMKTVKSKLRFKSEFINFVLFVICSFLNLNSPQSRCFFIFVTSLAWYVFLFFLLWVRFCKPSPVLEGFHSTESTHLLCISCSSSCYFHLLFTPTFSNLRHKLPRCKCLSLSLYFLSQHFKRFVKYKLIFPAFLKLFLKNKQCSTKCKHLWTDWRKSLNKTTT